MTYQQPQYQPPQPPVSGQPFSPPPPGYGYQQQPPKKRKKWPWIVGGIVLLALLGCGGLALAGVFGAAKAVSDLDDNSKGKNAVAGAMNKPTTDGKFQFTVSSMRCGVNHVGSADFGETAQGDFCLVNVTIKNVGDSPETFDGGEQSATGSGGASYSTSTAAETDVNSQDQTFLQNINPGNVVHGTLVFDVPAGTKLSAIVLHESSLSAGVKVPLK